MAAELFIDQTDVNVNALFLGQHIPAASFQLNLQALATSPVLVSAGETGAAVLFEYGAVVMFGLSPIEEAKFLADLKALVGRPYDQPETEQAVLRREPTNSGKVENGHILLAEFDLPRLQIVADVLAKSVVLAEYEIEADQVFEQIEPFAMGLQQPRGRKQGNELLRQLGNTLLIQNKLVGQAAMIDKPELLWEYPELERLYLRVEDEYEIRERHSVLEKKLELVSRTVETALELQQQRTSVRLEWYIVILIVLELLLSLYELFVKG
jgi:uncharacterized Rmd1/YagE family protein